MSLNATISLDIKDTATPAIEKLIADVKPERMARILRQPLETFWRQHLKKFPRLPGRFAAFPATGFGERASRAVRGTVVGDGVQLTCSAQGIRLRYHGGTIKPVKAKVLCFGVTPAAYGKTPADFGYVKGVKDPEVSKRIRENFAFAKSVTQRPNPAVLPTEDEFREVAFGAITRALEPKGAAN